MSIDALVIRYEPETLDSLVMATLFLDAEFDLSSIRKLYQDIGLSTPAGARKSRLVEHLASYSDRENVRQKIVQQLLLKNHGWLTFKAGTVSSLPQMANPGDLVVSIGEEKFYGPISHSEDEQASWYIRPIIVPHWEISEHRAPESATIRWLCFIRVANNSVSLHWSGFSHAETPDQARKNNVQFPYWERIPAILEEFQQLTRARLTDINLHNLVLYDLWDEYRYDSGYLWIDKRIRAESGGISLNARAGKIQELEVQGIRGLAKTIRCSIDSELIRTTEQGLPDGEKMDEVILRTLLREYGTLSYEFSLEDEPARNKLFRAHAYFGQRGGMPGPDCFPHLRVFTSWQSSLSLLQYLLRHIQIPDDRNRGATQARLFG